MKKAYLSLILACLVPLVGVYFVTNTIIKKSPDGSMLLGPALFPGEMNAAASAAKF